MSAARPSRAVRGAHALLNLLAILAVAVIVLTLLDTAVGIARGGDRPVRGRAVDVHVEIAPDRVRLPDGFRESGFVPAAAHVERPTTAQLLESTAIDVSEAVLLLAVVWLLRGIVRSVRGGEPFGDAAVRRLRAIGLLLVLGAPAVAELNWTLRELLYDSLPDDRFGDVPLRGVHLPGTALLAGLGVFVLAEVFAHGVRLREDLEGTV